MSQRIPPPLLGDVAPAFDAQSSPGPVSFPEDYPGSWALLFSHPADLTPVCAGELTAFTRIAEDFRKLNADLIGLSIGSTFSHVAWLRALQRVQHQKEWDVGSLPVIADVKGEVAQRYGLVAASGQIRGVFFVDPDSKLRAHVHYPPSNGRKFEELKRLLVALQASDRRDLSVPLPWAYRPDPMTWHLEGAEQLR